VEVPASASTTAYRVVQEALTNVLRHSGATRARVSVRRDDRGLTVRVTDYGRPRHTAIAGSGRGLAGLRERVALFGGAVHSGPSEDGWHLEARIPVADA
jgi:Signal transduction histidine kinase